MNKQPILIFDLDGTIADTLPTVIQIYNGKVAPRLNCKPANYEDRELLNNNPVGKLFKEYGINWYKMPFVIYLVKKHLHQQIKNIQPFPCIINTLNQLKKDYTLGIVTSNSQRNAYRFLDQHQLFPLFDFVYTNRNIFTKHKTLNKLITKHQFEKRDVLYIGDETRDIHAARKAGIGMISVTWGFLGKELLAKRNPDLLVDEPDQLINAVEQYFTEVIHKNEKVRIENKKRADFLKESQLLFKRLQSIFY